MDNEVLEMDRIAVIRATNEKYNLEENAYLSFSGGKDSTTLHYLLDLALPGNRIPRVFINTGIEYKDIVDFVNELSNKDDRIIIIKPTENIRQVLSKYGYPYKSKEHSHKLSIYQRSGKSLTIKKYLGEVGETHFICPERLKYQFTPEFNLKVNDKCCYKLKKEPAEKWSKENNRKIVMTGMRADEGGQRANLTNCILLDKDGSLKNFHPLIKVDDEWEDWFINKHKIKLCKLYYEPYNFKRTGCKGCPYSLNLQHDLTIMEALLPIERKQCEIIWEPVYKEYRRTEYRLSKDEQLKLF